MTSTGIGYSNKIDSFLAGAEAAEGAMKKFVGKRASLVLTFCSGKHNPQQYLNGVRHITSHSPLIGGAAMGVFTNTDLYYEGYEAMVTVFVSDTIHFQLFSQPDLDLDAHEAGIKLGAQIKKANVTNGKGLIVFYDTVKTRNPPMFNFATPLFSALENSIDPNVCCVGCGLVGDLQLLNCFQFINDQVVDQHVLALLISGDCQLHNVILHGCKPASSYKTITKAEGPVVYEIDHRPALEVIDELMGYNQDIPWDAYPLFITLGVNKGEKFGAFREEDYANRLCLAVDKEKKALIMFEPDLKVGDDVQLMHRSIDLDYITNGVHSLKNKTDSQKPLLYFYINCVGRAKPLAGGELEDVEEVQKAIGSSAPISGFYSGVEVARVNHHLQALDWTGVLCLLTEPQ
jgi:hypothetical protein